MRPLPAARTSCNSTSTPRTTRSDITGTLPGLTAIEDTPFAVTARGRNLNELLGIIGVAVPPTRAYALKARLVQSGDDYRFTDVRGHFGDSDIAGRFTVTAKEPRTYVWADVKTRSLDIVDVAPFIGYNPDLVAAGEIRAAGNAGPQRILPDTPLDVADRWARSTPTSPMRSMW